MRCFGRFASNDMIISDPRHPAEGLPKVQSLTPDRPPRRGSEYGLPVAIGRWPFFYVGWRSPYAGTLALFGELIGAV